MRVTERVGRSFTNEARRRQIVEAAIGTIAEVGFQAASFARIAQRAGLSSTRLISYHFAGRDDLMEAVVSEVFALAGSYVEPFVVAHPTPAGQLRGLIEGHARFYAAHRTQVLAVRDIWYGMRRPDGSRRYGLAELQLEFDVVSQLFRAGQQHGEFRDFDPGFMARTLRFALGGLAEQIATDPEIDLDASIAEFTSIFDAATRRPA